MRVECHPASERYRREVDGDTVCSCILTYFGGCEDVGFCVVCANVCEVAGLAQSSDVVNVDSEFHRSEMTKHPHVESSV